MVDKSSSACTAVYNIEVEIVLAGRRTGIRGTLRGLKLPFVSFLDPVVPISEPVKLQADNDADVGNLETS